MSWRTLGIGCVALALLAWGGVVLFTSQPAEERSGTLGDSEREAAGLEPLRAEAPNGVRREAREENAANTEPERKKPDSSGDAPAPQVAQGGDDLRVRVVEESTGKRTAAIGVRADWVKRDESGTSSYGIQVGKPAGDELELLIPRSAVEARAERTERRGRIEISLDAPFEPAVERSLSLEPWPQEPVELTAPSYAFLELRLQDAAGNLLDARGALRIRRAGTGEPRWSHRYLQLEHGAAAMPCGLNLALEIEGELDDRRQIEARRIDGPKTPHERLSIPLQLAASQAMLVVRVLDPETRPLAKKQIEVCVHLVRTDGRSNSSNRSTRSYTTDGEGRLRLPIEDPSFGEGARRVLAFDYARAEGPRWTAFVDVSRELAPGETSLGDVMLVPEPLVASGRVVGPRGEGIANATVNAELVEPSAGVSLQYSEEISTDERGAFALHSPYPFERVRLNAGAPSFVSPGSVELAAGSKDVALRLERAASVRGSVVLPEGMDPTAVRVTAILPATPSDPKGRTPSQNVSGDRTFVLRDLTPGRASISFRCGSLDAAFEVKDVELVGGEECRDERLQDVELCANWHRVALRLVDETMKPISSESFRLQADGAKTVHTASTDDEGRLACWTPPEETVWMLRAREHGSAHITWAPDEQQVRLANGIRVSLPIDATLVPPFNGWLVQLSKPDAVTGPSTPVVDDIAELIVPEPGRYHLFIWGEVRSGSSSFGKTVTLDPPIEIEAQGPRRLSPCRISEAAIRAAAEAR